MSQFSDLIGKTLTAVTGLESGSERVIFECDDGSQFALFHEQDCCESVDVNEVIGNAADLIGSPILMAEEVISGQDEAPKPSEWAGSWLWTFYKLATVKGYVTIRWLGESNGYYSESVTFAEVM